MKKITFALLASIAMLFVSCDENDDADVLKKVGVAAKISSPDWIVGNWHLRADGIKIANVNGFIFDADNMCQILLNNSKMCYKDRIKEYNNAGLKNEVLQELYNDSEGEIYQVEVKLDKKSETYQFQRNVNDSLRITWLIPYPDNIEKIKYRFVLDRK